MQVLAVLGDRRGGRGRLPRRWCSRRSCAAAAARSAGPATTCRCTATSCARSTPTCARGILSADEAAATPRRGLAPAARRRRRRGRRGRHGRRAAPARAAPLRRRRGRAGAGGVRALRCLGAAGLPDQPLAPPAGRGRGRARRPPGPGRRRGGGRGAGDPPPPSRGRRRDAELVGPAPGPRSKTAPTTSRATACWRRPCASIGSWPEAGRRRQRWSPSSAGEATARDLVDLAELRSSPPTATSRPRPRRRCRGRWRSTRATRSAATIPA